MAARFKTFTAGSVLTASEVNTYLAKQAVINCDSSADYPSAPVVGMTVYDLNDDALYVYAGATSGWRPPWNMPWGRIGGASSTTSTTGITATSVDINNLSVTFTAVANRYYRTTIQVPIYQQATADGYCNLVLSNNTSNLFSGQQLIPINGSALLSLSHVETIAAGSVIRKARINVDAGSGTVNVFNAASILVEDIGPAGSPS